MKHRDEHDHSSHRFDLRMAIQRAIDAAVRNERIPEKTPESELPKGN